MWDDHGDVVDEGATAIEPSLAELQQQPPNLDAVAVKHVGPIQNQQLPARIGVSRSLTVADVQQGAADQAVEILGGEDDRRRYIIVMCTGNPIYLGHDKQAVINGTAGILPASTQLRLDTSAPVFVRCATPANTAVVSYWAGSWAD